MNTNDLPPAARLAALMEAGRAAYPDLGFDGSVYFVRRPMWCGCALAFAALGAGAPATWPAVGEHIDALPFPKRLKAEVERMAREVSSVEEIILSLREGALAKIPA
jgi:hypothetical protein